MTRSDKNNPYRRTSVDETRVLAVGNNVPSNIRLRGWRFNGMYIVSSCTGVKNVPSIGHSVTDRHTSLDENRVLVVGHNGQSKMVDLRGIRGFLISSVKLV